MVSVHDLERASTLAREAVELVDAGHKEAASRNLREAIAIAPDSEDVKTVFRKIREDEENSHPLLNLCRRFVTLRDEGAAREATQYLRSEGLQPPPEVALECVKLLLAEPAASLPAGQDDIITGLVRQSSRVRSYFAGELQVSVTGLFDKIYDRGDGAVVCLDMVVLERGLWQSEHTRKHCEEELFQLFIAKLMESGHDHDGRSLKGIARLLVVDAESLKHLVDEEGFDVIFSSLDRRLPADVRSQATLATAKYLEVSGEAGQTLCANFIKARVAKHRKGDYIIAFSGASVVFPIMPEFAVSLFLTESFLKSLIPLLARKIKCKNLELAVLELFNAASVNGSCREAISKHFLDWLSEHLNGGTDEASALAAVVLAKLSVSPKDASADKDKSGVVQEEHADPLELVNRFKTMLAKKPGQDGNNNLRHLVEGLAYASVKAEVKEQLANDAKFLRDLIGVLLGSIADSTVVYGGLMIIHNITAYRPNMSEEQKKMSELKAYANASKPRAAANPLDDDGHTKARCVAVVNAGVMPLLAECGKSQLASPKDLVNKIILSLSKDSKARGKLAQQGAVKLLISSVTSQDGNTSKNAAESTVTSGAHALARILISVNPSHVFPSSGFPQITSAIRPLNILLTPTGSTSISSDQPRDLLPVFESLLALTNLASYPDQSVSTSIVRSAWPTIEDLLLSHHTYIQRAACELVCNLMSCEAGVGKFADGTHRASQRMHILLALADIDDLPTRSAAGGALAMLTGFEGAVSAIVERPRGIDIVLGLCQEDDDGLVHRGVVCVQNIVGATGDIGRKARISLREKRGMEILRDCLTKTKNPVVMRSGVEALKQLVDRQVSN
ncbi:SWI5-dependent HO expression protein 4 [Microsporum canis]|uniref:CRO1 protein n=1 Tax=Arthroderma otae (strain ATCC MYA-4605 / CBS 113480) TaxID=554155 RepID=C5FJM4_ARTOC|nr:CRO1 protein [Microsporum canis CBS 113480]EEQ30885.1 CRO1 protein [Microsporum canis CBS 113480]